MQKLPFNSFNNFLKKLFKTRVYKISIDANFSCPNRDGTKSKKGCIFCSNGSSSQTNKKNTSIKDQILNNIKIRKTRYKAKKFIVYFQSFSNTYESLKNLKKIYDKALFSHKDILGISISTRPDCIDKEKIQLIKEYTKKFPYVCIEYGMQTCHEKTLKKINRKETHQDFLNAIHLTKKYDLFHCAHVILGLPGEDLQDQIKTAKTLYELNIHGVKIHPLVVIKNTPLEKMYLKKKWNLLEQEEFIQNLCSFIEHLPKTSIIHGFSKGGYIPHILEPTWIKNKKLNLFQKVIEEFQKRNTFQGFHTKNSFFKNST